MLLHSRQKRKVICSCCLVGTLEAEAVDGAGEAMVLILFCVDESVEEFSLKSRSRAVLCQGD